MKRPIDYINGSSVAQQMNQHAMREWVEGIYPGSDYRDRAARKIDEWKVREYCRRKGYGG